MSEIEIKTGVVHELSDDIKAVLLANTEILDRWNALTPLMRNERICRVTIVKKQETRDEHLVRLGEDLLAWKKRPCCWPGCPHRRDSAKKWFKGME